MRRELIDPRVTPALDFPSIPSDLRPLPCPDGYAPTPMRALVDRLNITATRILLYLGGQFFHGQPCAFFTKGRVGEELGQEIGRAVRTTEDELKKLERRGYVTVRDQVIRGVVRTFVYANYALRDELPELGGAPNRADSGCAEPHRPAFDLIGRSADFERAPEPSQPAIAAQPGDSSRKSAETRHAYRQVTERFVPQPETCAIGAGEETAKLETCAIAPPPSQGEQATAKEEVAPENRGSPGLQLPPSAGPECAYVDEFGSPLESPFTCAKIEPERPFINLDETEILAHLKAAPTRKHAYLYTPALMELTARGIEWPEAYRGKPLFEPKPQKPEAPQVRVTRPLGPVETAKAEAKTLEAKVRELAGTRESAGIKPLTAEFMEKLGESPTNRHSWQFHARNLKEIADGIMPPSVISEALSKFRSTGADYPRKVFASHVKVWRKKAGLTTRDEERERERKRRAAIHPRERG